MKLLDERDTIFPSDPKYSHSVASFIVNLSFKANVTAAQYIQ